MLRLSPPIAQHLQIGKEGEAERQELLRKARTMDVKTITVTRVPDSWTDDNAQEARRFLDDNGMRVGEFTGFYKGTRPWGGLGGFDRADHEFTINLYRRQLRIAKILGAHFVGFGILNGRTTGRLWDEDVWESCMNGVRELCKMAEDAGMDVAGHPHTMSPLSSVARMERMLDEGQSPRLKILLDPVNIVTPFIAYRTGEMINECFDVLGKAIVGIHAKDVTLSGGGKIVAHIDEAVPGTGTLDYPTLLRRMAALGTDITIHAEHYPFAETVQGQMYIRSVGRQTGVAVS